MTQSSSHSYVFLNVPIYKKLANVHQALANNVQSKLDIHNLPHAGSAEAAARPENPSKIPIICIPTSLSGGEYTPYAGVTDDETKEKTQFSPPLQSPSLIVLSGEVATTTPLKVWLESGV